MKSLLWQHLPCNDDDATALAAALNLHPTVARLLCLRGFGDPGSGRPIPEPVARSSSRSVPARRTWSAPSTRLERALARQRAHRGAWRLRRRRHHVDSDPPPGARDARRQRSSTSSRSVCATATACSRRPSIACTPMSVGLIVSVDCGIRGTDAARRARELGLELIITDHHEPEGTLPDAVAVINPKRHDCTLSRQASRRRRRRAEARAGALHARRERKVAARLRQDRRARHAGRRRAARRREPRHRALRPGVAVARVRTPSVCARCSMPRASPARRSTATKWRSSSLRGSTRRVG